MYVDVQLHNSATKRTRIPPYPSFTRTQARALTLEGAVALAGAAEDALAAVAAVAATRPLAAEATREDAGLCETATAGRLREAPNALRSPWAGFAALIGTNGASGPEHAVSVKLINIVAFGLGH